MLKYMRNFELNQLREKVSCSAKIENLLKTVVSNADNPEELKKWVRIDINDLFSVSLSWKEIQDKYDTKEYGY